jgi:hypothetical protein
MDYHTILESVGIAETAGAPFVIWVIKEWIKLKKENKDLKERVLKFELKEELRGD